MTKQSAPPPSIQNDLLILLRGCGMGGADVIPGVSGGTIALILGIYRRLVTAISHVDVQLLKLLRQRQWKAAAVHLDLRFLVALAIGIAIGFAITTLAVNRLLSQPATRAHTLAVFFGMILASAFLVGRMIQASTFGQRAIATALALSGAGFAFWLTRLDTSVPESAEGISLFYLFLCGSIAICAMILPGISGAMVLLIMGVYVYLTDIPHQLLHGENVSRCLAEVAVFGSGCAISLILFSKILRWLLERFPSATFSLLCGFMFGAVIKVWPFQLDTTPKLAFKYKTLLPVWPESWGVAECAVLGTAAAAMLLVFVVDYFGRQRGSARQAVSGKANAVSTAMHDS